MSPSTKRDRRTGRAGERGSVSIPSSAASIESRPLRRDGGPSSPFRLLQSRWLLLAVGLIAGVTIGLLFAAAERDTYTASAYAVVVPEEKDPASLQSAASVAQGYARVATKPSLVTIGLAQQRVPLAPDEVREYVRASASPDTPIVEIFATRPDPREAARLADAVVDGLIANGRSLRPGIGYGVQRFIPTTPPTSPSNPSTWFYAGLGGAAGLMIAGLIAFTLGQSSRGRELLGVRDGGRASANDEPQLAAQGAGRPRE